jgi:hypothetical protein
MTPKEKAIELRQEFVFRINEYIEPKTWDEVESLNTLIYKAAKDCAELAIEEILQSGPTKIVWEDDNTEIPIMDEEWWESVKQEIENL